MVREGGAVAGAVYASSNFVADRVNSRPSRCILRICHRGVDLRKFLVQRPHRLEQRKQFPLVHGLDHQPVAIPMHDGFIAGQLELHWDTDGLIAAVTEEPDVPGLGHSAAPFSICQRHALKGGHIQGQTAMRSLRQSSGQAFAPLRTTENPASKEAAVFKELGRQEKRGSAQDDGRRSLVVLSGAKDLIAACTSRDVSSSPSGSPLRRRSASGRSVPGRSWRRSRGRAGG